MSAQDEDRELSLKLWVVLSRAHAALADHAQADVVRHGLTLAEFGVLEVLFHRGPLLLGAVQRKVLVSSGGITYLVDRLVRQGLVERRPCPEDRRARYAALTGEGTALIERIFPDHARAMQRAMAGLAMEEKRAAAALVRTLGRSAADQETA
ncbi:MAG: MarR family transcriptional regulator [Gemmatimonadota bacterium]